MINATLSAKNLGFYFDSKLSLDAQLNNVSKICYINLRNIGRIGSKLNRELKIQLVHSCVHSILDNGNATYGALNEIQLRKLQKIQNAGVRFIYGLYGKNRRQPISPYLKELHFLPVRFRIQFKIALLTFKCLNNLAPKYLAELIKLKEVSNHEVRIYNDFFLLALPPTPRYTKTCSAFSHSAPNTWNALPHGLRCMSELSAFKAALKTHYFKCAYKDTSVDYGDIGGLSLLYGRDRIPLTGQASR